MVSTLIPEGRDISAEAANSGGSEMPASTFPLPEEAGARRLASRAARLPALLIILFILTLSGLLTGWASRKATTPTAGDSLILHTVTPRDLDISITARGTMESQENIVLTCKVDNLPNDGIYGAAILWMIENGSWVEKGDLLAEIDATYLREKLDQQLIETIRARGQYTARKLDYENRLTINEITEANAKLELEKAALRLQQYGDEQGGTYQIALQSKDLLVKQRVASQRLAEQNREGTEQLYELGYKSRGDLAQARLESLRSNAAAKRAINERKTLATYERLRTLRDLEGQLAASKRALKQTKGDNEARRLKNKIWMQWAELGLKWKEQYLARYQQQLKNCKIYAPVSGLVTHHVEANRWGHTSPLKPGSAVRYGQPLLSIPDLRRMQAKIWLHETVVDRVHAGMSATVRLESFPDRTFDAEIRSIDVLPDPGSWVGTDTKRFTAIVVIDQDVDGIKPGMTAIVDIHAKRLTDVLCVPLQAIVHRGEESWCYVFVDDRIDKRLLEIGSLNDSFAEVQSGLHAGDQVVMNPATILESDGTQHREITPDTDASRSLIFQ
jgi:HlyD family secretion protein